jgi:hypothetical protein
VKKILKTTATVILMAVSFIVLAETFCCPEETTQTTGDPVECCLQCCPRHNLAPPLSQFAQPTAKSFFEKLVSFQSNLHAILLVDNVFHPPRV